MNKRVFYIVFILLFVLILSLTACQSGGEKAAPTPTPTEEAERTPTPTPPPTATPAPTPRPLSEEQKGIPQEESEEIFKDEFKDDKISIDAFTRGGQADFYAVIDEQLYLSYDGYEFVDAWDTYAPDWYLTVGDTHSQYEIYIDMQTTFERDDQWMACFLGVRTQYNSGEHGIPTDPSSGFWVAICKDRATIYPGTANQWAAGLVQIQLPESAETMHTYIIVDDGQCVYYYMVLSSGERHLLLKADISGETTVITDANGEELLQCDNMIQDNTGGYFRIFNHMGNTIVDKVVIKGYR